MKMKVRLNNDLYDQNNFYKGVKIINYYPFHDLYKI